MGDSNMSLDALARAIPKLQVDIQLKDWEKISVTPWFSFTTTLPEQPLPSLAERAPMETDRLIIRPITPADLDALWELRQMEELQKDSKERGRADRSKEETEQGIANLMANWEDHWYWGAFLKTTGEMIAEGGMPKCTILSTSHSGWPEAEFLVNPRYWRQGYGREMFKAIVDSWWALPREWRRLQILPALTPGLEPGATLQESLVFNWEDGNDRARDFYAHVLAQKPTSAEGFMESYDMREGREGNVIRWAGTAAVSSLPPPPRDADSDDD